MAPNAGVDRVRIGPAGDEKQEWGNKCLGSLKVPNSGGVGSAQGVGLG